MMNNNNNENRENSSPTMLKDPKNPFPPKMNNYEAEYYDVLTTMIEEQCEHLYAKPNESYLKVTLHDLLLFLYHSYCFSL
jgi:hypothetical protein